MGNRSIEHIIIKLLKLEIERRAINWIKMDCNWVHHWLAICPVHYQDANEIGWLSIDLIITIRKWSVVDLGWCRVKTGLRSSRLLLLLLNSSWMKCSFFQQDKNFHELQWPVSFFLFPFWFFVFFSSSFRFLKVEINDETNRPFSRFVTSYAAWHGRARRVIREGGLAKRV